MAADGRPMAPVNVILVRGLLAIFARQRVKSVPPRKTIKM